MEPLETLFADQETYNVNSNAVTEEEGRGGGGEGVDDDDYDDNDDNKKPATSIKPVRRIPLVRKEIKRRRAIVIPRMKDYSSEEHGRDIVSVLQNDSCKAISSQPAKRRKRERLIANSQLHNAPNKKLKQFDERLEDLKAYKDQHGHCNARKYGEYQSLGRWCSRIRWIKGVMDKNGKPKGSLSDDQVKRLDDIGFIWNSNRSRNAFDDRLEDLKAYKDQHGHCNVKVYGEYQSLGQWCSKVRCTKRIMDKNEKTKECVLSDDQVKRLNDIGFPWNSDRTNPSFDERLEDLKAYKDQHGHCNFRQSGECASLGQWCGKLRRIKRAMDNNEKPRGCLTNDQIQRLNDMGFLWNFTRTFASFDDHFKNLKAYKDQHGHCNVHMNEEFKSLWRWCAKVRWIKRIMDKNGKPVGCLSNHQVKRLNDIGFLWNLINVRRPSKRS